MSRGSVFVGLMFLGMGIGLIFDQAGAGTLIGMGLGFIALALIPKKYKRGDVVYIEMQSKLGQIAKIIIGLLFIIGGLYLAGLLTIPEFIARNIGAFFLIAIGLLLIIKALFELSKSFSKTSTESS
ncbi:hypothetical protein J4526_08815 [Desulfurococcaceae archaeon MEX13E-LK6-19]|nr:hypothetical protein J4526_08815 [Desulfurococcaceae archaeon MEX13E-LK6-19]